MFAESVFFLCHKLLFIAKSDLKSIASDNLDFIDGREIGILFIAMDKQISQTEIASIMEIDKNTTRFLIDHLETKGLLERQKNPTNRKENLIVVTKDGVKKAKEIFAITLEFERKFLYMFDDEEYDTFRKLLVKFYHAIDSQNSHK